MGSRLKDLTGQRFGTLVVQSRAPNKRSWTMWNCHCDCGKDVIAYSTHLIRGNSKSCGCLPKGGIPPSGFGNLNPNWLGYGEISGRFWGSIYYNATRSKRISRQNLPCDIDIQYVWELFLSQNRKCALSGIEIGFNKPVTASLDRIDSNLGYVKNNVQWVHKDLNRMKNIYNQSYFIDMCRRVTETAGACEI